MWYDRSGAFTDTTRDLSSRYVLMLAPDTLPAPSKSISTNLPNLEELSLRTVFAFPKASNSGLDSSTYSEMEGIVIM